MVFCSSVVRGAGGLGAVAAGRTAGRVVPAGLGDAAPAGFGVVAVPGAATAFGAAAGVAVFTGTLVGAGAGAGVWAINTMGKKSRKERISPGYHSGFGHPM